VLAVNQFHAGGAECVEVVRPCGLSGVGRVDARKDDHRHGSDALAKHGEGLVIGDSEGELGDAVGAQDADEDVGLGCWSTQRCTPAAERSVVSAPPPAASPAGHRCWLVDRPTGRGGEGEPLDRWPRPQRLMRPFGVVMGYPAVQCRLHLLDGGVLTVMLGEELGPHRLVPTLHFAGGGGRSGCGQQVPDAVLGADPVVSAVVLRRARTPLGIA